MAQANPAKIARTAKNKEMRALRHAIRMDKQSLPPAVPRGTARSNLTLEKRLERSLAKNSFQIGYKTPMRHAFENLTIAKGFDDVAIAGNIFDALQKKIAPGMYPIPSVQINLTHATAKRLNAPHYDVKDFAKAAFYNPMV